MTRSSIYRLMDSGDFPRPVRVGPTAVRWRESDITGWLESLPIARSKTGPPNGSLDAAWTTGTHDWSCCFGFP